jgi:peptidoglycan/LPS O-acetylase OafA/YrhL
MFRNHVDLNGIGHLWSLAVEEQFYLIWPFVIYYINTKTLKKTLFSILLIVPIFRFMLFYLIHVQTGDLHHSGELVYLNPFSHFDAFASGALIIFFEEKFKNFNVRSAKVLLVVAFFIVVFVGAYKLINEVPKNGFTFSYLSTGGYPHLMIDNYGYFLGYTILNLFFAILIFCVIKCSDLLRFLKNRFLVYTGKISYGLYMYHVPVLIFTQNLKTSHSFVSKISLIVLYFLLTYFLASLSFKTVERYFMNFKQKFI